MSLLSVLNSARSSLAVTSQQSAIVARNVGNADDPSATRKYGNTVYDRYGSVEIRSIAQSSDPALYRSLVSAQSSLGTNETLMTALDRVRTVIGDVEASTSPSAGIAALKNALSELSAQPENAQLQRAAVAAAEDLATNLNRATEAVQAMRADADESLAQGAMRLEALLSDLEAVNKVVVTGTNAGADVTDAADERDRIVADISSYVGVSVQLRANNDLVLSTDSGIVMFETRARSVEFTPTGAFDPSTTGVGAFKIDGVSIGSGSSMAVREGSLVGALKLRDEIGPEFQSRIDQTGDALVGMFSDEAADGSGDLVSGLFVRTGAATISVSQEVIDDPSLLRDGGINGAEIRNVAGDSGYSGHLNALVAKFSEDLAFPDGQTGTLGAFAADSMAWFEGERSRFTDDASYQQVLVGRARESLSNETGINLDEEMSRLLELERSYQASTKLLQTVGNLLDQLLAIR